MLFNENEDHGRGGLPPLYHAAASQPAIVTLQKLLADYYYHYGPTRPCDRRARRRRGQANGTSGQVGTTGGGLALGHRDTLISRCSEEKVCCVRARHAKGLVGYRTMYPPPPPPSSLREWWVADPPHRTEP
jgi:hypothetical protein